MQTNILKNVAILCCAMLCTVFTSCGKEDNPNNDNPSDSELSMAEMSMKIGVSDDLFSLLDLTVEYYDESGKIKSEAMTTPIWNKTVKNNLPCKLGARLKAVAKSGVQPSGSVDTNIDLFYAGSAISKNGQNQGEMVYSSSTGGVLSVPAAGFSAYVNKLNGGLVSFLFEFNSKGTPKAISW